jgi:hypothetical protein
MLNLFVCRKFQQQGLDSISEIGFFHNTGLLRHQGLQKIKKGQRIF